MRKKWKLVKQWGDYATLYYNPRTDSNAFCITLQQFSPIIGRRNYPKYVRLMRLHTLRQAIDFFCEEHQQNRISQTVLEELLDYIYAELNRRLNKSHGLS